MPTILRFRGFNIVIYTDDHSPAHVHVVGNGGRGSFYLGCDGGDVSLRNAANLRTPDLAALTRFIAENRDILCEAWRAVHHDQ